MNDQNPWSLGVDTSSVAPDGSATLATDTLPASSGGAGGMSSGAGALSGGLLGAGLGILQSIGAENAYQAKMKQAATFTKYSPWTHLKGNQPATPNELGMIMGGAAGGATQGASSLPALAAMAG